MTLAPGSSAHTPRADVAIPCWATPGASTWATPRGPGRHRIRSVSMARGRSAPAVTRSLSGGAEDEATDKMAAHAVNGASAGAFLLTRKRRDKCHTASTSR